MLTENFSTIINQLDAKIYSTFSPITTNLGHCQATFLLNTAENSTMFATAHHCLDWWAVKMFPFELIFLTLFICCTIVWVMYHRKLHPPK